MSDTTVFSGIQPTGSLTLGNYLGAIRTWVELQETQDCVFSIVDLHSLNTMQEPAALRRRCMDFACLLLSCGIDPGRSILFQQSRVSGHAELAWLLGSFTRMGELRRMTQYKEKARRDSANLTLGLFAYPVLMAADILLYDTALVPVGEDQRQHVELARDVAIRFNNSCGPVFRVPEVLIGKTGSRVRSLLDPGKKMSKSDKDARGSLALLDPPDAVRAKVKAAVTGSGRGYLGADSSPGIDNLVAILAAVRSVEPSTVASQFEGRGYAAFKSQLAEEIIGFLEPIQRKYARLRPKEDEIRAVLEGGAVRARRRAAETLARAYDAVGLS